MTGDTVSTSLWAESIPAAVAAGGRESHMREVLTVVEQSLKRWKTNQRHTRDFIMDTWMLKGESEHKINTIMNSIDQKQLEKKKGKINVYHKIIQNLNGQVNYVNNVNHLTSTW